jgi:hypothetical protein
MQNWEQGRRRGEALAVQLSGNRVVAVWWEEEVKSFFLIFLRKAPVRFFCNIASYRIILDPSCLDG